MNNDQKETAVVVCAVATVAVLAFGLGKVTAAVHTHFYNKKFDKALANEKAQKSN